MTPTQQEPSALSITEALKVALAHVGLHGKLADAVLPIIKQERATAYREGMEAERERCAKIADNFRAGAESTLDNESGFSATALAAVKGNVAAARSIAAAIRAQMETGK